MLYKKVLKILNFRTFLPVKEPLLATLSETRALNSGKNVVEQDIKHFENKLTRIMTIFYNQSKIYSDSMKDSRGNK